MAHEGIHVGLWGIRGRPERAYPQIQGLGMAYLGPLLEQYLFSRGLVSSLIKGDLGHRPFGRAQKGGIKGPQKGPKIGPFWGPLWLEYIKGPDGHTRDLAPLAPPKGGPK